MKKYKKYLSLIFCLFILISNPFFYNNIMVFADSEKSEFEIELEESVDDQLNNLDMSNLDLIISEMANKTMFEDGSFSSKIKKLIKGDISIETGSIFSYFANVFIDDILSFLPSICLIIAIAVLYSMLSSTVSLKNKKITDIIHFVCYGAIVIIVISGIANIINLTSSTLNGMKKQMDAVFPLLLTVLTALGGTTSVGVYQPAMAVLSSSVINIFTGILLPIFTFKLIFTVISNLTNGIKFNKFSEFFGSCFKWIIGIILTIFSAFVSIQGIMAGSVDGISIKTAKYTIKSGIPIIGSFLADGMGLIMVSSSLIKNAIGVGGLLLMFCTIVLPVVKILVFSLLMKLASAVLEPIADNRVTCFVNDMSKSIAMIISLLLGVAFMYLIIIGLIMCSANIF